MSSKYAILIGINGYHESLGRLKYCVNDVRRLADVLTQGEDAFPKDRLLVLTDDGDKDKCPTYANIHSWLASYLAQAEDDDTVFVYFAGHGREHGGKAYLLPSDATLQTVHVTGIPVSYVQELLDRCKARQKVLVLDACHSGAGRDVAAMSTGMLNELSGGKGIYTITSCDADELSHEWGQKKHGVFSYFLSEGLAGGCPPDAQNRVTAESLYEWVYDRVRNWARKHRCTQTPKRFSSGSGAVVLATAKRAEHIAEAAPPPNPVNEPELGAVLEAWIEQHDGQWSDEAWRDCMLTLYESGQAAGVSRDALNRQLDSAKANWLLVQETAAELMRQNAEKERVAAKREAEATELAAWRSVQKKPTVAACERYLRVHGRGAHAGDVQAMLAALRQGRSARTASFLKRIHVNRALDVLRLGSREVGRGCRWLSGHPASLVGSVARTLTIWAIILIPSGAVVHVATSATSANHALAAAVLAQMPVLGSFLLLGWSCFMFEASRWRVAFCKGFPNRQADGDPVLQFYFVGTTVLVVLEMVVIALLYQSLLQWGLLNRVLVSLAFWFIHAVMWVCLEQSVLEATKNDLKWRKRNDAE